MTKHTLVIPIGGQGSRFTAEGYDLPKALLTVGETTIVDWALRSVQWEKTEVVFIPRQEHMVRYGIGDYLNSLCPGCRIIPEVTPAGGAALGVYNVINQLDPDQPLSILCPDIYFTPKWDPYLPEGYDGLVLTFKSNSANYSYIETRNGEFIRTAEKQVISNDAAAGLYNFKNPKVFGGAVERALPVTKGELYICPLYNFIGSEAKILAQPVDQMHIFGTPDEKRFFEEVSWRSFPANKRRIALCSDHSGFQEKEWLKQFLNELKIPFIDYGTFSPRDCDYPSFVHAACQAVSRNVCDVGIGFCRSGQGINITANKEPRIRSAHVVSGEEAVLAIRHNCANFFAIPAGKVSKDSLADIVKAWAMTTFDGGRHQNRLATLGD